MFISVSEWVNSLDKSLVVKVSKSSQSIGQSVLRFLNVKAYLKNIFNGSHQWLLHFVDIAYSINVSK